MKTVHLFRNSWFLMAVLFQICFSPVHSAREKSHDIVPEIMKVVTRIEEQLTREERIRRLTDMVRIETTMDNINKKLDRVLDAMDHNPSARMSHDSEVQRVDNFDGSHINSIDDRLSRMEQSLDKVEAGFDKTDFAKLEDIDQRSAQLSRDLNQKLRKMMNIITALYEMNKEFKTNFGGRSDMQREAETPSQTGGTTYAAEFLVENLEELERKIKEQFSVLGNEIRTEITGLKIVASSVSDGCDKSLDFSEETPSEFGRSSSNKRSSKKDVARNQQHGAGRSTAETDALDTLMQSLGRSTREIREEIHQGIQILDNKLSNLTHASCIPGNSGDLEPSASSSIGTRVSRDFQTVPEQVLDNDERSIECTRVSKNTVSPKSCADLRIGGANCDGVYVIFPKNIRAVRVFCDMTTEGGGWTLLMRRGDFGSKMTSFHKNWLSYKNGFGDVEGEFWLGNDVFHLLTSQEANKLRVHLESFDGENTDMTYSSFKVANETDNYRLTIGPSMGGTNSASNSLRYHNNHPFSTFDKKNDNFEQNCAATYKGGWWFNGCYFGFLTGEYFRSEEQRENWQGMLWYDWKGNAALKGAYMMIRPKNFTIY